MENNSAKIDRVDALVIGGGFKGMMVAYGLLKKGQSVCIVDNSRVLGGFMTPMKWQGVDMDKGPQYLDGVDAKQRAILDEIMAEYEPLTALEFSYSSYWHGHTTQDFAIPDYRTLPKMEKSTILYESLTEQQCQGEIHSITDTFNKDNETTIAYLTRWCHKFLNHGPEELSVLNQNFVTFFGRKLILDNELSLNLKQHPLLDDVIAADKKQINHNTYNLYPMGKTLGYFREAFDLKLNNMGVQSVLGTMVTAVEKVESSYQVMLDNGDKVLTSTLYCAGTIENSETLLLGTESIKPLIHPISQVFYLIELAEEQPLPFYTMNYDSDSLTRVTCFDSYSCKNSNGKPIICVEVPTTIGSERWQNPESHFAELCNELQRMGIGINGFGAHKAVGVPSTYRALLKGYESTFADIHSKIKAQYGDDVHLLTPHLLTRASIMQDLFERGILSEND